MKLSVDTQLAIIDWKIAFESDAIKRSEQEIIDARARIDRAEIEIKRLIKERRQLAAHDEQEGTR